jgi:hypothetical protein
MAKGADDIQGAERDTTGSIEHRERGGEGPDDAIGKSGGSPAVSLT